jgi:hypothetical protein
VTHFIYSMVEIAGAQNLTGKKSENTEEIEVSPDP